MTQAASTGGGGGEFDFAHKVGGLLKAMEAADPSGEASAEFARLLQREYRPPVEIVDGEMQVRSMDDLWRVARAVWASGIVPSSITSLEALFVCLSCGLEAGLSVMQSLRGVMVVNNVPSVWGDMAMALVRASPLCEWIKEWEEFSKDDGLVAICETQRRGDPEPIRRTWSERDNKTAGLDNKTIHKQYPGRMRKARARAFCIRDVYPDVLGGLSIVEEQRDVDPEIGAPVRVEDRPGDAAPQDPAADKDLAARVKARREAEAIEAARREVEAEAARRQAVEAAAAKAAAPEAEPKPKGGKRSTGDANAEPPAGALESERRQAPGASGPQASLIDPS